MINIDVYIDGYNDMYLVIDVVRLLKIYWKREKYLYLVS